MSQKTIKPWIKNALELGPLILFFILYSRIKDDSIIIAGKSYDGFIISTAAFIPLILISTGVLWRLSGELSKMQVLTAVLVIVFGGLSIWFNDERFFKMKPTIIYLLFGAVLGFGLLRGKSYLQALMGQALPLTDTGWMIFTRRFCYMFFALAATNELIWRLMSTDAWVNFKTFGLPILMFVFVFAQAGVFQKHAKNTSK